MTFPKLKLSYFDFGGRAEAARLAFFVGGVPFEDDRFPREEMATRKADYPYGVVPVLEVDGKLIGESSAIARYAGRISGLYPTNNPFAALLVDEIMQVIDEFGEQFRPWYSAQDPEVKAAEETKLLTQTLPRYLAMIDARLATLQQHPTFQDPTRLFIHEIWVYQYLRTLLQSDWLAFVPNDTHLSYKHWVACEAKVDDHPRVREWNAIQPVRPTDELTLTYFASGGRAEPIRLALHLGGIAFEDKRLASYEDFAKRKDALPFGQVPVLTFADGTVVSQSYAILRYVGSLTDLYPQTDDLLALQIDEILAVLDQLQNIWAPSFAERDPVTQKAMRETLAKETIPQYLGGLDKRVAAWSKPYATGETLTIADLAIFGIVRQLTNDTLTHVPVAIVDAFPALVNIHDLVEKMPRVAKYYATASAKNQQP